MSGPAYLSLSRAIAGGVAGTVALAVFCVNLAPRIGLGQFDFPYVLAALPARFLGPLDGVPALVIGWLLLIAGGIALALVYASYVYDRLPGPYWLQGLAYGGFGVFLVCSFGFLPLIGLVHRLVPAGQAVEPKVFGSALLVAGIALTNFIGHCMFGIVVGLLYRRRLVF